MVVTSDLKGMSFFALPGYFSLLGHGSHGFYPISFCGAWSGCQGFACFTVFCSYFPERASGI